MNPEIPENPEPETDDVEGHRHPGAGFGDDSVPRGSADSRPRRAPVGDDEEDDVTGHRFTRPGEPAHEIDRLR